MKKIVLFLFATTLLLASCQKEINKYTITATGLPEMLNGKTIYMQTMDSLMEKHTMIDSAVVENGSFEMLGKFNYGASTARLSFKEWHKLTPRQQPIKMILEPGNIHIAYDSLYSVVSGTDANMALQTLKDEEQKINQYRKERAGLYAAAENDKEKIKALQEEDKPVYKKYKTLMTEYIKTNINSRIGMMTFLENSYTFDPETNLELIALLPENYRDLKVITKTKELNETQLATSENKSYRDVKGRTVDGKDLALSEVLAKNKYVLLDFWASWCGPCIKEIPYMKTAYEKFNKKGFEILGASLDEVEKDWIGAIKEHELNWVHINLKEGFKSEGATSYGVRSIPTTVLIAKDGTIVARNLRGSELSDKLEELLK